MTLRKQIGWEGGTSQRETRCCGSEEGQEPGSVIRWAIPAMRHMECRFKPSHRHHICRLFPCLSHWSCFKVERPGNKSMGRMIQKIFKRLPVVPSLGTQYPDVRVGKQGLMVPCQCNEIGWGVLYFMAQKCQAWPKSQHPLAYIVILSIPKW